MEPKKTCFLVCPIGSDISPQRKHSDQALRHIIKPVLELAGFEEPHRADKISQSGNITRQIINHIRGDDLVIADLTGHNPNVFYELAIRHCTGKPFIQMIRKGENIPFDLGPMRTIFFDLTDPDDVVSTREELTRQVESAMAEGAQVDTPVGDAMDFERLKSGSTVEQMISTLIERVDAMGRRREPPAVRQVLPRAPGGDSLDSFRESVIRTSNKLRIEIDEKLVGAVAREIAIGAHVRAGGGVLFDQATVDAEVEAYMKTEGFDSVLSVLSQLSRKA